MTREEAIKRIRHHMVVHHIGEPPHIYIKEALDMAIDALREQEENRWRPASSPPKKHGRYLTACETLNIPQIRLYEGEWDSIHKVTHWKPLPKLPKEDPHG